MKPKVKKQKKNDKDINLLYFDKNENKTINKGKIIGLIILALLIVTIVILYAVYATNEKFRSYLDANILNKDIEENNLKSIGIADEDKSKIFA